MVGEFPDYFKPETGSRTDSGKNANEIENRNQIVNGTSVPFLLNYFSC